MKLEIRQGQKQTFSQHMVQSVSILQMTVQELKEYVNDIMLENPVIDLVEPETEARESIDERRRLNSFYEEFHYLRQRQNNDDEYDFKDSWNINVDERETLQEYLWSQLVLEDFEEQEIAILKFMLECLDGRGYLTESCEEISRYFGVEAERIEEYVRLLQQLEPAGICARNLPECLKLQLERQGKLTDVLKQIIEENLGEIANNKLPGISKKYGCSMEEVLQYCDWIRKLDPKPGVGFSSRERLRYIIPDVILVRFKDHFDMILNGAVCPKIEINPYYRTMEKNQEIEEVKTYLSKKIQQAEWVQQCIEQRNQTLMKVSQAIVENQMDFFEKGVGALKPLRMKDIAEQLGIHESTVSRAVSNKYLQCSWGVFPLNYFFSRGVMKKNGRENREQREDISTAEIKRRLRAIIESENKKKPYSDRILAEKLEETGIEISRRTVAKYREEEGIPGTSVRRSYE